MCSSILVALVAPGLGRGVRMPVCSCWVRVSGGNFWSRSSPSMEATSWSQSRYMPTVAIGGCRRQKYWR